MHAAQSKQAKKPGSGPAVRRSPLPSAAAAQRMPAYSRSKVQPKTAVGPAGDSFEREADSVAQRVASGGSVSPAAISSLNPSAYRAPAEPKKPEAKQPEPKPEHSTETTPQKPAGSKPDRDRNPVQKSEAKNAPGTAPQQAAGQTSATAKGSAPHSPDQDALSDSAEQAIAHKGPGRPISPATLVTLSERIGVDLSHVRIHDGPDANEACRALHARAFTHGSDIWLAAGESDTDINLMAHEVTHVVQQSDDVMRKQFQRKPEEKPAAAAKAPPKPSGERPVQRKDTPPPAAATGTGGKGKNASNVDMTDPAHPVITIPTISLPKFKAAGRPSAPSPYKKGQRMQVKKRPDTSQKTNWDTAVRPGVVKAVDALFATIKKEPATGASAKADSGTNFFIPKSAPVPKKEM